MSEWIYEATFYDKPQNSLKTRNIALAGGDFLDNPEKAMKRATELAFLMSPGLGAPISVRFTLADGEPVMSKRPHYERSALPEFCGECCVTSRLNLKSAGYSKLCIPGNLRKCPKYALPDWCPERYGKRPDAMQDIIDYLWENLGYIADSVVSGCNEAEAGPELQMTGISDGLIRALGYDPDGEEDEEGGAA